MQEDEEEVEGSNFGYPSNRIISNGRYGGWNYSSMGDALRFGRDAAQQAVLDAAVARSLQVAGPGAQALGVVGDGQGKEPSDG